MLLLALATAGRTDADVAMVRSIPKNVSSDKIFMSAEGFRIAHKLLCDVDMPIHQRMQTGTSQIVLSAMACELYLKCLVHMETGKLEWGHQLKHLFDRLEVPTKKTICSMWDVEVAPRHKDEWDAYERIIRIAVPRDLPMALKLANQAFEKLRYSYEGNIADVGYLLGGDLPWILRRVILSRRPEWAKLRPKVEESSIREPS
jgi:hypothetical protein